MRILFLLLGKKINVLWSTLILAGLMVGLYACTKQEQIVLRVSILNTANEVNPDIVRQLAEAYQKNHKGLIVSCTPETVSRDITANELVAKLSEHDIVIFPSIFNSMLRKQANSFYPVRVDENEKPAPVLNMAYAAGSAETRWAQPLFVDPVGIVAKKGDGIDTSTWQLLRVSGKFYKRDHPEPQPILVCLEDDPLLLADTFAAYLLSYGYKRDLLHRIPLESGVSLEVDMRRLQRSFESLKRFMLENSGERLTSLPVVGNLNEFVESKAFMTLARYSDYMKLEDGLKRQVMFDQLPYEYKASIPVYGVAAGVSIESKHPAQAEDFIAYLSNQAETIATQSNGLPLHRYSNGNQTEIALIPRENTQPVSLKSVIDAINGDLEIVEFCRLWSEGYFLPDTSI